MWPLASDCRWLPWRVRGGPEPETTARKTPPTTAGLRRPGLLRMWRSAIAANRQAGGPTASPQGTTRPRGRRLTARPSACAVRGRVTCNARPAGPAVKRARPTACAVRVRAGSAAPPLQRPAEAVHGTGAPLAARVVPLGQPPSVPRCLRTLRPAEWADKLKAGVLAVLGFPAERPPGQLANRSPILPFDRKANHE